MHAVPFFSDDITVVPHSLSSELADLIDKPVSIEDFARATRATGVSLYRTDAGELHVAATTPAGRLFMEGPEDADQPHNH